MNHRSSSKRDPGDGGLASGAGTAHLLERGRQRKQWRVGGVHGLEFGVERGRGGWVAVSGLGFWPFYGLGCLVEGLGPRVSGVRSGM